MSFVNLKFTRSTPYIIVLFFLSLLFVISFIYPYRIDADPGFQIKAVQQWLRGQSDLFNSVTLPSPEDISKDVQAWIIWWPPGISFFFAPLIALGLPLGIATKITSYFFFMLGCIGWLKVADAIKANLTTKLIIALILPIYAITIASLTGLIGDVIPFGIMPWLFLYTLYVISCFQSEQAKYSHILIHSCLLGILLGSIYWIKYSAFLVSLGLLLYLYIGFLFFSSKYLLKKRLLPLAICTVSLLVVFIFCTLVNLHLTGFVTAEFENIKFYQSRSAATQGIGLLFSFLGSIGLALFQATSWAMHLVYFSDRVIPFFASLNLGQRELPLAILGIPGTAVVIYLLFYSKKVYPINTVILGFCVTIVPFILLTYLTHKIAYNFVLHSSRFASAFFIFPEILLVSSYIHLSKKANLNQLQKVAVTIALIYFFILPNSFVLMNFAKNGVAERIGKRYITTENQLYVPVLSEVNVKSVVEQINSVVKSPQDIVVLALDEIVPTGAWLEMKQRTLPLIDSWGILVQTHGTEGANLRGSSKFTTSKDLRLILVISKSYESDSKMLLQIKQRFPQATKWIKVKNPRDEEAAVSILYSDLKGL